MPTAVDIKQAKLAHDIFLSNLIVNHILLFVTIATMGPGYLAWMALIPVISILTMGYSMIRAHRTLRGESEFVFVHWQIALRWNQMLALMLLVLISVSGLAWYAYHDLGLMREMAYALAAGLGLLPTMIAVLVLVVIESDALNHARQGSYPKWARRRFLRETV